MYEHPLTAEHVRIVQDVVRYHIVGPIGKNLACGDVGLGAMTEWSDIVKIVVNQMKLTRKDDNEFFTPEGASMRLLQSIINCVISVYQSRTVSFTIAC